MMRGHTPDDAASTRWLVFVLFFVMFVGRRAAVLGGRIVANCTGLKRAIERQQHERVHRLGRSSHDMRFELLADTVYNCESTIHIPRSESVVIVGASDGTSQISFRSHRKRPPHRKDEPLLHSPLSEEGPYAMGESSLFLNEGTLRLENVILVSDCLGEGCDRTGTGREEACGVRLVQNFGELFVSSSVLGTGDHNSYNCFCGTKVQGQLATLPGTRSQEPLYSLNYPGDGLISRFSLLGCCDMMPWVQVYSEGTESSVVIQGSTLMGPSPCGGSAMAVVNGHITVIDSILTGSHDQVGSLFPFDERDHQLRISATVRGTVCESETPEFCGLMKEMVEVVHIDTANCGDCSGVHHNPSGSAVQANNILRPERGLSGSSSGIVIDQGLLLLILTVGLIMLVVLLCFGDIWIRSHPRHPVSMFFTLPAIPSPTGNMPWKEDGTAFLTAPKLGPPNPFSNYAVSDDEISYVVPPDVHETLEQSASRIQSISSDGQKVEGISPSALNIRDQEIRHEYLESALRGYGTTEGAHQGGSKGAVSPGVMRKGVEIEGYVTNQSREKLDSVEIYSDSTQIPDLAAISDDGSDEPMVDVAGKQLGAVVDRPSGSIVVEGGLKSSHTAAVSGSGDSKGVEDHADATTSLERAARTALDTRTALSKSESLGAEHLEHELDTAHSAAADTDAESAVVSFDTGSEDNIRDFQPNEKDIEPNVEAESRRELAQENRIDIERELEGPVTESMREGNEEGLATAAVDESVDSVKEDFDGEGEIEGVGEQNTANIFDQRNTANLSTAELGIPGSNYSGDSSEHPQVVPTERVRPEAFRKLELTRSMSSTAIEISPVSSSWKLRPSRYSDSAMGAPSDSDSLPGELKAGDKMGPSCPPSKDIVDDPMSCSSPERRQSGGLDPHDVSPAGVRIKPTTPLSSTLGINRGLGMGDNPYRREIVKGATIKASAYEPPLSASNLSYSPPSTEGEDECMAYNANLTRPFFDEGTKDPAHLRLREEQSGATHSPDRASEDSDDSPFAYLSLSGPFTFDLAATGKNGEGGEVGVPEFPSSVSSSDDSDVLRREDESAAAQVSSREEFTSTPEGSAVESVDFTHAKNRHLSLVESKKKSQEGGSSSSTESKQFFSTSSLPKDIDLERAVPNTCLESTPPERLVESAEYLLASNEALVVTETAERPANIFTDMPSTPAETSGTPSFFSSTSSPTNAPSPSPAHRQQTQHVGCEFARKSPCQPLSPGAGTSLSPERVGSSSGRKPEKSFEGGEQDSRRW